MKNQFDKRKLRKKNTVKLSITLSEKSIEHIKMSGIKNRSNFINWLLEEYYNKNFDGV